MMKGISEPSLKQRENFRYVYVYQKMIKILTKNYLNSSIDG